MTSPTPSAATPLEVTDETVAKSTTSTGPKGSESRSPGRLAWKRFKRDKTGVISAYVVIFFFVIGIAAPLIAKLYGKNPYTTYTTQHPELLNAFSYPAGPNGGMSSDFWFGIEPQLGRDVFTFLLYAIRNSLGIATAATLLTALLGVVIGVTAGYLGGKTDYLVGRIIDILLSFPSTLFFIAFMPVVFGFFVAPDDNIPTSLRATALILVLSAFGWASIARLLRGQVLGLREREFVEAAKVTGASPMRIVFKELLPNLWTPIIIQSTLLLPAYVTAEAGLAFLGVGMIDPTPDWGVMIGRGAQFYTEDLTFMLFPGISMVIFVLAFNLLGDSVRDALDPKSKR
ncbi:MULTISPECIES: ABC transporter permease [Streptomyces]|uniref:Peptide/nickel transport system permease protein n=1 Tax=Streptomyces murinus TaxID=33900 RepID=A0A7W3RNT4_STRMR|nr:MULTISPECIES: ABC transporter permease [Streptomyces]MBA9055768.1 peptide/nickel transport system permease protein [Streptomyces murinus]WSI87527.1 ABC transporter permease [Streptomyces murinus]SCF57742.1 peptide/nickel transport system permease protein [Streptomyces sp. LamerLS-31b]SCF65791.1 peptide/nickel transport system permease protein [Streptomyces sp. DconLS]